MTAEKYLKMCEQIGEEPDPDKIPPDVDDFPLDVQKALLTYNKLGDRAYPDIGYMGKDFTTLPIHIEILKIEKVDLFLETLLRLDTNLINKSQLALKKERDKIKSKQAAR